MAPPPPSIARPSSSSSRAAPGPDPPRQPLRAAGARHQAEPDLGQAEPRRRVGDDQVADERHLEPAAHRARLHGGDDRLGERLQEPVERAAGERDVVLDRAVAVEQALELGQVGARHEGLVARAGEHDRADAGVGRELARRRRRAPPARASASELTGGLSTVTTATPSAVSTRDGVAHRASP